MSQTPKNWLIAVSYLGFIYATLGIVGVPLAFLRSHGLLRFSLGILYFACFLFLVAILFKRRRTELWRYVSLCAISAVYFFIAKWVQSPEEQIHFFQYGLVGVFFVRALEAHFRSPWKIFIGALFLATLAGGFDEFLQGLLPNRHYDIRDIFLNAISAFLGLIVYQIILPPLTRSGEQS